MFRAHDQTSIPTLPLILPQINKLILGEDQISQEKLPN